MKTPQMEQVPFSVDRMFGKNIHRDPQRRQRV